MNARFELFVSEVDRSVAFYRDVLGFVEVPGFGNYHPMKRGSVVIGIGLANDLAESHYFMPELTTDRKGVGVEIVLEIDDIQAEYTRVQASGYQITEPLKEQPWGLTDFRLADPDGYYLRITSKQLDAKWMC